MIAAPAEAVPAPDLPDGEPGPRSAGKRRNEPGEVTRRRVIFAAQAPLLVDQCRRCVRSNAFGEDTHLRAVTAAVGPAAIADDVVVQHRRDLPAMTLGIVRQYPAAEQPLFLAGQHGI